MAKKKEVGNDLNIRAAHKDFVVKHDDMKLFSQKYKMEQAALGSGAFGMVKKATLKANDEKRAVKIIDKLSMSDEERVRLSYEVDILKNLNHPNILRLYEVFEGKERMYIVTELCDGTELFEAIQSFKSFNEKQAAAIIKEILMAVAYCHANQVSHRDLKPENILIEFKQNDISLKVIDFGTSHHYEAGNHQMTQLYGTPYYIAPEVLHGDYNEKCDVWSIGIILHILLSGMPPFYGSDEEILAKVKNFRGTWEFADAKWHDISEEAKNFLRRLMHKDPAQRVSAQEALQDPWITQKVKPRHTNTKLVTEALGNLNRFKVSAPVHAVDADWNKGGVGEMQLYLTLLRHAASSGRNPPLFVCRTTRS